MPKNTPITSLHDAARQLQEIHAEVERILDEAELLEVAHHQAIADATAAGLDEDAREALAVESGWRAYYDAADALRTQLDVVDQGVIRATFGLDEDGAL